MLFQVPPSACLRAREAVSERLDGELSELDGLRLDAHLHECVDCREFAARADALTSELRAARLELPATIAFEPRRQHVRALRMHGTAAAAMVALAAGSVVLGRIHPSPSPSAPHVPPARTALAPTPTVRNDQLKRQLLAMLPASDRWRAELESGSTPAL